jgi:hypothetical protein
MVTAFPGIQQRSATAYSAEPVVPLPIPDDELAFGPPCYRRSRHAQLPPSLHNDTLTTNGLDAQMGLRCATCDRFSPKIPFCARFATD